MIREQLIHFIWRYRAFDCLNLKTMAGDTLTVDDPGIYNRHAGPDFLDATIRLNGLLWKGNIEIHVRSSDWNAHGHTRDPAYNNVMLHVVWEADKDVLRHDGTAMPTFCIAPHVNSDLLYKDSFMQRETIPCKSMISLVHPGAVVSALEQNFHTRIHAKARRLFTLWHRNSFDWEQTAFAWIARHMGFHVNNESFEVLGESISYRILLRHRDRPFQVEALLFGMAGLLETGHARDPYWVRLRNEFLFLKHKYSIHPRLKPHEWKFLRMRPANFPTMRIAQLCGLVCSHDSMLNWLLFGFDPGGKEAFKVSDYWKNHYYFGKVCTGRRGRMMGRASRRQLWLNVVPPLALALKIQRGDWQGREDIFASFFKLPPENNTITRKWKDLGVNMGSAMDSQSYYALFHQACKLRKCLECPVGVELLRTA